MSRTLVVGAGPSGLVALKTLRQHGIDAIAYEKSSLLGGQWVLDNPSGQSSSYDSLETNTTRRMSSLSDFEFPDDTNKFISRSDVLRFWNDYADKFGLLAHIHLETRVESMKPAGADPASGWDINAAGPNPSNGQSSEPPGGHFDAAVIATGNYWDPRNVNLPGNFDGQKIHAKFYRNPQTPVDTTGKHVVVIGPGSTGCEIAAELGSAGTKSVALSARSGVRIVPKTIDGIPATDKAPFLHPLDELPTGLKKTPERLRRRLFYFMAGSKARKQQKTNPFDYAAVGLPQPPHPLAKRASVSQKIFAQFAQGTVRCCPEVVGLDGLEVVLADGTQQAADVIIEATGYHMTFPFIDNEYLDTSGDDLALYRRIMHPDRTDLFVVGIARPLGSFWVLAEAQSQWIAQHLAGQSAFPSGRQLRRNVEQLMGTALLPGFYGEELRADARRRRVDAS